MNIQAEKLEIIKIILETNDPGLLNSIKKLFKKEPQSDFWDTLSSDQKEEIQQGINEIDRGETVDYDDFIKKHR
ncbi:MAG TPA: hypothetical protein VK205_10715 [Prolixibacteraceae bacterium]|nr:hypothetical protein [Prolixibacteraceae bacterium]